MPDVFISYARSTEEQATLVERTLQSLGYSVWRDAALPPHRTYADVIEEQLRTANAVVVLWSADGVKSQWVRAEADAARAAGTLIQADLDGTLPPMPFNQIQTADLRNWNGETEHAGWQKVETSVALLAGTRSVKPKRRRSARSICVLPFANMSQDAEQEYFSDGISEDITTDLSKVSALEVIARNTAFQFKGRAIDVAEVAQQLAVSHILEGSVRKAGNRIRITAQLIDGETGAHVWADRYDRDLTDVFLIQDEISKAIVEALKVRLLPSEKVAMEQRGTTNADAYDLYLMARNSLITGNHGDPARDEKVVRLCARAVELDPTYARAWALMALAQVSLRYCGKSSDPGLEAAERALSIDPNIAEAHCAKAHNLYELGDFAGAKREIDAALKLEPESWEVHREAARLLMAQKDISAAAVHFEKAVAVCETDYVSWAVLATCYQALADKDGLQRAARMMVAQSDKALAQDPNNGSALGVCAGGLAILGEAHRAKKQIERALLIDPGNLNLRYNFACVLTAYLNEKEAALTLLEPVMQGANVTLVNAAAVDPDFDTLRDDPRFESMLAAAQRRLRIGSGAS
jgi:adenylate cyclase